MVAVALATVGAVPGAVATVGTLTTAVTDCVGFSSEKYVDSPGASGGEKFTTPLFLSAETLLNQFLGPSYPF
jgi:hypothetical protein